MDIGETRPGYRPAEQLMSEQVYPQVCETCGATVAWAAVDLHDGWHREVVTTTKFRDATKQALHRQRYNA